MRRWFAACLQFFLAAMKKLINNIDCVRIELDGINQTYYLPRATSFAGRFIDAIYFYAPQTGRATDFLTGKKLIGNVDLAQISLNLRDDRQNDIVQNYPCCYSRAGMFYNMVDVSAQIDWENSYLRVSEPIEGVLLMYVVYSTTAADCTPVRRYRTVEVPAGADTALKPLINSAFFDEVKQIIISAPTRKYSETYGFITLVTTDGRVFDYLPFELFWNLKNNAWYSAKDRHTFNHLTIDWQKSHIYNSNNENIKITFAI